MNNDEIRYKLLKTLYERYYSGKLFDYPPTEEIIKNSGLEKEDPNTVFANVDYISKSSYVDGLRSLGTTYPTNIRLDIGGIQYVESKIPDLQDYHNRIRFKILSFLYEQHFGGMLNSYIPIDDEFINNLELSEINDDVIHGDLIYLEKNSYIKGLYASGRAYPFQVMIDTYGIDTIEQILNESVEELSKADIDSDNKIEIEQIGEEGDKKSKIHRFGEFVSRHESSATKLIIETIKAVINNGISGA